MLKTHDLAIQPDATSPGVTASPIGGAEDSTPKPEYPSFTIRNNPELIGMVQPGQEFKAEVTLRVVHKSETSNASKGYMPDGQSVDVEVIDVTMEHPDDTGADDNGGSAADSFFAGKGAPDDSAAQ